MNIRITGGKFRGKKLIVSGEDDFRPTKSRVREALCSSLMSRISEASCLDLCGGSGAVAFDFLSFSAGHVTVVEVDPGRCRAIQENVRHMGVSTLTVEMASAYSFLTHTTTTFDIIFYDPPYYDRGLTDLLCQVISRLAPGGVAVFEWACDDTYAAHLCHTQAVPGKTKQYGHTCLTYFYA
ncbi:RsmD family RNA methyltransferase [Chitinivibrio alkaliphilus]|uniref:S-adenosylmethionine-dependent methyltransferase n=1 Tax=Chitinivibrio alkaliphilus ACht1 TaxID=1313304 RepID=U7D932_9BACT|nr:RsmD family RNA methyltransferase [Chitinivibrio alkaliphilus]ERP31607.1 S-adenosylmethionine-dependent methyltransferase [Chitinivibrio alkaliphilus ACht1]